jgi:hypothetical protein
LHCESSGEEKRKSSETENKDPPERPDTPWPGIAGDSGGVQCWRHYLLGIGESEILEKGERVTLVL